MNDKPVHIGPAMTPVTPSAGQRWVPRRDVSVSGGVRVVEAVGETLLTFCASDRLGFCACSIETFRAWVDHFDAHPDAPPPPSADAKLEIAREALRNARHQFRSYEQQHLAKHTFEADAKAATNAEFAALCDAALTALDGDGT